MKDGVGVEKRAVAAHANDQVDLVSQLYGLGKDVDLIFDRFEGRILTEVLLRNGKYKWKIGKAIDEGRRKTSSLVINTRANTSL